MRVNWHSNWKVTLLVCAILPILLRLGFWQLERAEEKRDIQRQHEAQNTAAPLHDSDLQALPVEEIRAYRRVTLEGRFLPDYTVLLDNQIVSGRPGYHVVTLFEVAPQRYYWLNRGWIAGRLDRQLPDIPATSVDPLVIQGSIYIALGEAVLLARDDWQPSWPLRVQSLDLPRLAKRLSMDETPILAENVFPHSLRLEPESPGALEVDWQIVSTRPEKHIGYAVQWFAMAGALFCFWVALSVREGRRLRLDQTQRDKG